MSRSSRIGETENRLRHALDRGDVGAALGAAREPGKFQARGDLALGTAIRLTVLLSRQRHRLAAQARERCIERCRAEIPHRRLAAIFEAALEGLGEDVISEACARILLVLARDHEWTPVVAR